MVKYFFQRHTASIQSCENRRGDTYMEQNRYVAFISYRHLSPDKDIAVKLHKAIETYGIPGTVRKKTGKKKMGRVFRDQDELPR